MDIRTLSDADLETAFAAADREVGLARQAIKSYEDEYRYRGGGASDPHRHRALVADLTRAEGTLSALRIERQYRARERGEDAA